MDKNSDEYLPLKTEVAIAITGSVDSGKCFKQGTPILKYDGSIEFVENIKVGDQLMGDDSTPRTVLETHIGHGQLYEIKSQRGNSYVVNGEHILCLKYHDESYVMIHEDTHQIEVNYVAIEDGIPRIKSQIFSDELISQANTDNNTLTNGDIVKISVNDFIKLDNNVKDKLHAYHVAVTYPHKDLQIEAYEYGKNILNIQEIENDYKINSRENRLKLLAGIIDTIGSYDKNNYLVIPTNVFNNNANLIADIEYVIGSLGFLIYKTAEYIYFNGDNIDEIPITKADIIPERLNHRIDCGNITVTPVEQGYYYGFEVDCNNRFLLGDFTVVHNSTLLGVLKHKELDDGTGKMRAKIAKHPHEIQTGKTSAASTKLVECEDKKHGVTFIDLCGHEKYLKTTADGIHRYFPDYGIIVVAANRGILKMTLQHIGILFFLEIPVMFVITRVDLVSGTDIYETCLKNIISICKKYKRQPQIINSDKELIALKNSINEIQTEYNIELSNIDIDKNIDEYLKSLESYIKNPNNKNTDKNIELSAKIESLVTQYRNNEKSANEKMINIAMQMDYAKNIVPIITISNKNGYYIDTIHKFIDNVRPRRLWDATGMNGTIFYIDQVFNPTGIGIVVSGIVKGNTMKKNDVFFLGPKGKDFIPVRIKSFHNDNREEVDELTDHQRGCISITCTDKSIDFNKQWLRKGMIMVRPEDYTSKICFRFKAEVEILHHSATIGVGYSPVLHYGPISQTCRITNIADKTVLTTGDKAIVEFKFIMKPEFVETFDETEKYFFFREGTTRGRGKIIEIVPIDKDPDPNPDVTKQQKRRARIRRSNRDNNKDINKVERTEKLEEKINIKKRFRIKKNNEIIN